MTLNTIGKTGNNNPLFAMMKSIFLLFIFVTGVNTHSVLAKGIVDANSDSITNTQNIEHRTQATPVDAHRSDSLAIDDDIAVLPNAVGFGNVYSLHDAMQLDDSGKLQTLVEAFIQAGDIAQRHELTEQILTVWADTGDVVPGSRGSYIDAQQLEVLEAFLGQKSLQANPTARYAASLQSVYDDLLEYVYTQLSMQTHYASEWKTIVFSEDNGQWTADFSNTATWLAYQVALGNMDVAEIHDFKVVVAGIIPDNPQLENQLTATVEEKAQTMPESVKAVLLAGVRDNNTLQKRK